jgi:predicted dehydrogenase
LIRFGLIGTGVAAGTHARELARVDGARLEAVFARDAEKAAAFAAAFSIPRPCSHLSAFLADLAVDAVIVTTPNGLHLDYAVAAAKAGKHVVVEKPLEINEARAEQIVAACREAGVGLFVVYQRRYSDAASLAMRDIRAGKLGRIFLVNIVDNQFRMPSYYQQDGWRGTKAVEGGGCVITQSTHLIDLAQYLVGPITSVFARSDTVYHNIETEDVAVATLEFEGGVLGTFSSSTAAFPGQRHLLTISGTRGAIIINGEHDQVVFRSMSDEGTLTEIPVGFSFADPSNPRDYPTDGQRAQLQAIVDVLRKGTLSDSDADDAMMAVKVIDAIYRSAAASRPIRIATGKS